MKEKFSKFSLPLLWIFAFFVIIIMMTFTSHAATQDNSLPYVVNPSYTLSDDELSFISDVLDHFNFHSLDEPVIIFKEAEGWWYDFSNNVGCLQYRLYFPTVTQQALLPTSTWHDNKTFSNFVLFDSNCYFDVNFIDVPSMRITKRGINQNYNNAWEVAFGVDSSVWRRFYGTYEVRHENNISGEFDWVPNYPAYTNFSWGTSDGYTDDTFLTYFVPSNSAGAVAPNFDDLSPIYDVGASIPGLVPPNLTLPSFSWSNPPTPDFSTLEKGVESLYDLVKWVGDNINNTFNSLKSDLQKIGNNITQTLQYYGNLIIANIQNCLQNFYDNMVGVVQPIFDKLAYITEEVDSDEINAALNNTSFIGLKNQFNSFFTTFENAFDISEPSTFTLTINIQNIDTFYNFGCRSPVIIHLDEHFTPIKTALRTFLWILISFGTVFVVERGLSDWLRGENDTK